MNIGTSFKFLLRLTLGALFVSVGLYSVAFADRGLARPTPAVQAAPARIEQSRAKPAPAAEMSQLDEAQPATLLGLPAPGGEATPMASCPSGQAWTCCSCGICDCRPSSISPLNFCKNWVCRG